MELLESSTESYKAFSVPPWLREKKMGPTIGLRRLAHNALQRLSRDVRRMQAMAMMVPIPIPPRLAELESLRIEMSGFALFIGFLLSFFGLETAAQTEPAAALKVLHTTNDKVSWDAKSAAVADVTCDGFPDVVVVGLSQAPSGSG